jgi:hypothetical protein
MINMWCGEEKWQLLMGTCISMLCPPHLTSLFGSVQGFWTEGTGFQPKLWWWWWLGGAYFLPLKPKDHNPGK